MKENTCIFNDGVDCNEYPYCAMCGWNPEVEKERKASCHSPENAVLNGEVER